MKNDKQKLLLNQAEMLVKNQIKGTRKGMPDVPNHTHSFRVAKLLKAYGFDESVQLAGLLHDVVEDGGVTFTELIQQYPKNVVDMVRLCTHDTNISQKDRRWIIMVAKLTKADSREAFAIKLADVFDNLMDAHMLPKEREMYMREVKIPALLFLSRQLLKDSPLWRALNHVALSITQRVGEVGGILLTVKHELESINITEPEKKILLKLCDEIDKLNYGSFSKKLFDAIGKLHDAMEDVANKGLVEKENGQLIVLANGLCGDMMVNLEKGKAIYEQYRAVQASQIK